MSATIQLPTMRVLSLFLVLFLSSSMFGQTETPQPVIGLLLSKTSMEEGIPPENQELIDDQLHTLLSDGGGISEISVLILKPSIEVLQLGRIGEGDKKRRTAKLNLKLKLVQTFTSEEIAVHDVLLVGSGENVTTAIKKAIITARNVNPVLRKTIAAIRQSAFDYFEKNCNTLLETAQEKANNGNNQEAFSMLHAVPAGLDCFDLISEKKAGYYKKWQETACATQLQLALTSESENDLSKALDILSRIDAEAACFAEAKDAGLAMEPKLNAELEEEYKWLFSFYQGGGSAEAFQSKVKDNLFFSCLKASGRFEPPTLPKKK